jgi:hypothetical protein
MIIITHLQRQKESGSSFQRNDPSDIRLRIRSLEVPHVSPARPSDKSNIMGRWVWNIGGIILTWEN